jgi:hypothetical protein
MDVKQQEGVDLALRYNTGKPKLSMIPFRPLKELAKVYEMGVKKYGRDNWRKGLPWTGMADSCLRHLGSWLEGENDDAESGLNHLLHAAWNLITLVEYSFTHPELDDRFKGYQELEEGKEI